jgi:hypothetical protein
MDKWEKQLKKDVNPSLSKSVDERIERTFQQLPRRKKRSKYFVGLTAAMVILSISFGASFFSPAFADTMKNLPVFGSAFEFVGDKGVKKGTQEGLTTELGEQIEVDGQVITFTETLYDGGEIHIGYVMETIETEERPYYLQDFEILIDGRYIGNVGMGGNVRKIEQGLYAGTFNISVRDHIPDSFVLEIRPREGRSWSVKLPVTLHGNHKMFIINDAKKRDDLTILYDKLTFFPTSTEIDLRLIMEEETFFDDKYMMLDYQLVDDQGRVLEPFSGGGGGGGPEGRKVIHTFKHYFEPLDPLPNSITIKPFLRERDESIPKIIKRKWQGQQLILPQGDIGEVTVLDVVETDGVLTLIYTVNGDHLYEQANAIWIEDSKGTRYDSDESATRVEGKNNKFQLTFSHSLHQEEFVLNTVLMDSPNFLKKLEVTIDLNEVQ